MIKLFQELATDGLLEKVDNQLIIIRKKKEVHLLLELNLQEEIFQNRKKTRTIKVKQQLQVLILQS